ncbi:4'-phosphopantetheinyl transferase family protein [Bacillus wiedmannii]|uniref:4'-phosphopantetheinyl transferase family protein n=1 Tax=Bacillus wiedmannii TaxID=1890302 RepID=UPI000D03B85D|nr:4'-phosphopantetheinyl transferase superfamily protein [Bacillus wiedmannii]PRT33997.1 4'-phosphopantetheinyl transferase [Bacillus wiedmannii]PRT45264.1 4'-phosphopantetheinyl transferase [Bacillus wiedmannii]
MISTYAMNIKNKIDKEAFQQLEKKISNDRREKIKKYHFEEDKKRSIIAELLLRHSLKKEFGINREQVQFTKNSFGKPMLKNFEQIYFNLAHSGDWVVCGVSDVPIGIDVEIIKSIDLDIAKTFFSLGEYKDIINQPKEKQITYFYKLWTLKESYVKAEGEGLSIPLNSFSFCILPEAIQMYQANQLSKKYCFDVFNLDNFHIVAVCSKKLSEEAISIVSIEDINVC